MSQKVKYQLIAIPNIAGERYAILPKSGSAFFSRVPFQGETVSIWLNENECYSGKVEMVHHNVKDCEYPDEDEDEGIVYTEITIEVDSYHNLTTY
jgi:small nuclear ribonucleoprotein (snRNP)-like protein